MKRLLATLLAAAVVAAAVPALAAEFRAGAEASVSVRQSPSDQQPPAKEPPAKEPPAKEPPAKEPPAGSRAEAHARVGAHLEGVLAAMQNTTARANIQAAIEQMLTGIQAEGAATNRAEAAAQAEAAAAARVQANPRSLRAYQALGAIEAVAMGEAAATAEIDVFVGGKRPEMDQKPVVREGRTLVPIRALVESLGAQVEWNAETRTAVITRGGHEITLTIGQTTAWVDGAKVELDVAAAIAGGRTMVPARFISQGLGLYVSWLAEHRMVLVTEEPVAEEE